MNHYTIRQCKVRARRGLPSWAAWRNDEVKAFAAEYTEALLMQAIAVDMGCTIGWKGDGTAQAKS